MPIFIDESGDTGTKAGASDYFLLAAVWVPDSEAAEAIRSEVNRLRLSEGLPRDYEFKFVKPHGHPARRRAFLDAVLKHPFRFAAAYIDKTKPSWKGAPGEAIHEACAASLVGSIRPVYTGEESRSSGRMEPVVVDDNEDGSFLNIVRREFRKVKLPSTGRKSIVWKVRFAGSGPDELLQLTDILCGVARHFVEGRDDLWKLVSDRNLGVERL